MHTNNPIHFFLVCVFSILLILPKILHTQCAPGDLDTDGDGICDIIDICPNSPLNIDLDNNGICDSEVCSQFSYEDFENGDPGIWIDGGTRAELQNNANYAPDGNYSWSLRKDDPTSNITTPVYDFSRYSEVVITFLFRSREYDSGDFLSIEMNSGNGFIPVYTYTFGQEFNNNLTVFNGAVHIAAPFSTTTSFRVQSYANDWSEYINIDNIKISHCIGCDGNGDANNNGICDCTSGPSGDTDQDGLEDNCDVCPGSSTNVDANQDGQCDAIIINEILTANQGNYTNFLDEDGDSPDYIELYNNTNSTINLAGWRMMDSDEIWKIPTGVVILANDFLVIWASGKDRVTPQVHANFSLSSKGEYLGLYDPQNNLVAEFAPKYPKQYPKLSYGYDSNGDLAFFNIITPGAPNENGFSDKVDDINATIGRGFYSTAFSETLTCSTPNAQIRYTLNGTPPTANSTLYTGPIQINPPSTGIVTIRAKAFLNEYADSKEGSWSYIFPNAKFNGLAGDGLWTLPSISINTDDQIYPDDLSKRALMVEMIELDSSKEGFALKAGVKEFGESSVEFEKSNFRIFFESAFGESDLEYDVFENRGQGIIKPVKTFDKLELRGGSWDSWQAAAGGQFSPSDYYLTDRFIKDTRLAFGDIMPHGRFVNVFVNGDYRGFYQLRERYDHVFYSSYGKGNEDSKDIEAIKVNDGDYSNNGDLDINGDRSVFLSLGQNYQSDKEWIDEKSLIIFTLMMSLMEGDFEKEYRGVGSMIEDSSNDYHFIYADNDFRLRPLGNVLGTDIGYSPGYFTAAPLIPFFETYLNDPEFVQEVLEVTADAFCEGPMAVDSMLARLISLESEIDLAMRAEHERWDGECSINYYGTNCVNDKYGSWSNNMAELKTRMANLTPDIISAWSAEGLYNGCDKRPQVNTENQRDKLNVPLSYFIEAIDPDGDAMIFSSSTLPPGLTINSNTGEVTGTPTQLGLFDIIIKVEDTNDKWGLHEFTWEILNLPTSANADVVINEIHFNPEDSILANGGKIDGQNFEFIELKNIGTGPATFYGKMFTKGVELELTQALTMQPNEFLVFASDECWFIEKYGFAPDGVYEGSLDNGGEKLRLKDAFKNILDSLEYDDGNPWPGTPDKGLFSLALVDATTDNADPDNWSIQSVFTTPKAENNFNGFGIAIGSPIVINEIHYNPFDSIDANSGNTIDGKNFEFLELVNNSNVALDISGYSFIRGITYEFDQGVMIQPYEHIVLAEDKSSFEDRYGFQAFDKYDGKLSDDGETIWLFNDDNVLIDVLEYSNLSPWDVNADGGLEDYSLALIEPNLDNNLYMNWAIQCSGTLFTPGAANQTYCYLCTAPDGSVAGDPCDDGDECTSGEVYDSNCNCNVGIIEDADNDGVCDANDQCPGIDDAMIGSQCDDGDPCTAGEVYDNNCNCAGGSLVDNDNDGVCDVDDLCPGFDDNLIGTPCDDGDPCTEGENYNNTCLCSGGVFQDSDNDGICDAQDNDTCDLVLFETFEAGQGVWQSNGNDAAYIQSSNSPSGNYSFRIRDNSGLASSFSCSSIDITQNEIATISFSYLAKNLSAGEEFILEISLDNGVSFNVVKTYEAGNHFVNDLISTDNIEFSTQDVSAQTVFRFQCNGSINADEIYIDDIRIETCSQDCENDFIQNDNSNVIESIQVNDFISSNGIIDANSNIEFVAGQYIEFNDGFEVIQSAVFHAYISPCN